MNTTPFIFSTKEALNHSWQLFKKHAQFFLVLALISVLLGFGGDDQKGVPAILAALLTLGSYLWSILWKKTALAAAHGQEQMLSFSSIKTLFPTLFEIGRLILLSIISFAPIALGVLLIALSVMAPVFGTLSLIVAIVGVVVCIVPGLYIAFRFSFSSYVFLEKRGSIRQSLVTSWQITGRQSIWSTIWVMLIAGGLYVLGAAFFSIGLLITYPLAALLMAKLYIALSQYYRSAPVSEQLDSPSIEGAPKD